MTSTATATRERPASADASAGPEAPDESVTQRGHIGRIVAGSLIGGCVGTVFLVTFPLAGEVEHMITGSVLLTFAAAWATLAVLSERWTDQPQRWAFVPAAVMAVAGGVVLTLAPTGNELGWIWPPVVLALVAWMIVRARRDLKSRARVWIVYPVCAALALSCLGGAYETSRESTDRFPMVGRLVDVGGHKLHINCIGSGGPTVVLEGGLGELSTMMSGWIAPDVARTTRVCVYDRAGRGWSESVSYLQNGVDVATDLHTLLNHAGEHGPYVLAGHSAGGIYVMNFAHLFPSDVAGVVLLDSMHPDQYTKLPGWSTFYSTFRRAVGVLPSLSRLGLVHLFSSSAASGLPPQTREEERAFSSTPRHYRSVRDEFAGLRTEMTEAKALTSLGSRPLIVLTAGKDAPRGWMPLQNDLTKLSTNSIHRVLRNATHSMLTEDKNTAAQSSQAIRDVVYAARTGTSIDPQ